MGGGANPRGTAQAWHPGQQADDPEVHEGARKKGGGQSWATFLSNHADGTWACDFIQAYDILFRQVYAFFIVHLGSRRVVYAAACRHPTQEWTTQQLRNATMDGESPRILLRDRDDKFGPCFDRVAKGVGTRVIKTAVRAPNMNAVAERFVGSARRELPDQVVVLDDQHLGRLVGLPESCMIAGLLGGRDG